MSLALVEGVLSEVFSFHFEHAVLAVDIEELTLSNVLGKLIEERLYCKSGGKRLLLGVRRGK